LERRLDVSFDYSIPVLRRFASTEEQNLWFEASDRAHLKKYLSTELIPNENPYIKAENGYGKVLHTGRLDTGTLLSEYQKWLLKNGFLEQETFAYDSLQIKKEYFLYKNIKVKHIVFTEGYGLMYNPFFNYLPMQGSKGEYLIIKSKGLKEINIIKSSIFLIPLGENLYKVGATYNRDDKTNKTTLDSQLELLRKLNDLIDCEFEVVNQLAGVRPTVKDRKPLVGEHPVHKRLWVLNGFGSHGIMIGPWAASALYNHIENDSPIDSEMNIERYNREYKV
ncbi:MAG: FAD-dependent oxidoreductase, partial [Maribacter sp.]